MKKRIIILVIALLLAGLLVACGGDEDNPLSTGEQGGQIAAPDTLEGDADTTSGESAGDAVEPGDAETIGDSTGGQGNTTTGGEVVSEEGDSGTEGSEGTASMPAFLSTWQSDGANVEMGGQVPVALFDGAAGQTYIVDDAELQVYQFADEATAEEAMATVSPDGGTIGETPVRWAGAPHFYRQGDAIVLYVGDDTATVDRLTGAFGEPAAGGS